MAKSTSRFICLLPKRRSAQLGFKRYLPGNDAIHGSAVNWTYIDIFIPTTRALATKSYGGIIQSGRSSWVAHFSSLVKNSSRKKLPAQKKIELGLLADFKVRQFGNVSFSKNGVESIITIKNQLAPHLQIRGDRRKPATLHEWPRPWAVSYNPP